jgi:hypothetical protein
MYIILEVLFVLLVAADTILTYKVIDGGKGTEIGPVARYYIDDKPLAIGIAVIAVVLLIGWLRLVGVWWIVVPTYLAVYLRLGYLIRKHVRILNG